MRVLSLAMPFATRRELALALGLLTAIDAKQMQWRRAERRPLPLLYESGVRYAREARLGEDWLSALEVLRLGRADCEDLSCYRAAELRVRYNEHAWAVPIRWDRGWHIVVRRADGTLEDPSVRLGMKVGATYRGVMERARKELSK